ncbi:hypothetical protein SUGI_0061500 [Cryptomeria japonica]|nr:hypothetical protein SUGI_0061500 [Cryptomeria japonica]
MPELTFSPNLVLGFDCPSFDPLVVPSVENIISNILLLHSHNLEAFHLHNTGFDRNQQQYFSRQNVCKWIRYASWCNVKHLTLFDQYVTFAAEIDSALTETPPSALFACTHLETLRLCNYDLTSFPIDFVGFPHLVTCHLRNVKLTDESLVSLISLCSLLQKIEIIGDAELGNVEIFSSTIEHLDIRIIKSLSVNCPKLKILGGHVIEDLSVNGVRFYELSYAIFHLEMHCGGTLRELNMDCSQGHSRVRSPGVISASRFLHIVGNLHSLTTLVIYIGEPFERESDMGVPLFNLLHMRPNLQVLSIFGFFVQELARDTIPVCLTSLHLNRKKICVEILEFDNKEIEVISCLL